MSKIKIGNQEFKVSANLKVEFEEYLNLIDENYEKEVALDLKQSLAEKVAEIDSKKEVTLEDFKKIKEKIGEFKKPIYKQFYRSNGILGGVFQGISEYFNFPTWIIRLILTLPILLWIFQWFAWNTFAELFYDLLFYKLKLTDNQVTDFTNSLLAISFEIAFWYILLWIFTAKAKTENQLKQLKQLRTVDFDNGELYRFIYNKINYKNTLFRKLITGLLYMIARLGIFAFDILVSILNNFLRPIFLGPFYVLAWATCLFIGWWILLMITVFLSKIS